MKYAVMIEPFEEDGSDYEGMGVVLCGLTTHH